MKKYLIITTIIAALFFSACNPNEEVYKEHDEAIDNSYNTSIEYVFTYNDYSKASQLAMEGFVTEEDSLYAAYIKKFQSFNSKYPASDYIPMVIASNFIALENGSSVLVTYNEYNEDFNFDANYTGDIESEKLYSTDYANLGVSGGCFTDSDKPEDNLPTYIAGLDINTDEVTYVKLTYLYPNTSTETEGFYKFDGTVWAQAENSYILTEADYVSMGNPGPGAHNNFSGDYPAENYLPSFMNAKFPSQNGEYKLMVYDYYSGAASTLARKLIYNNGWEIYSPAESKQSQFVHIGEGGWIFDPTVRFYMSTEDYHLIDEDDPIPYYKPEKPGGMFYGASSYYGNFNIAPSYRLKPEHDPEGEYAALSEEGLFDLMWVRLYMGVDLLLTKKFPDAVPKIGDFDVLYVVGFKTYDGITSNYYDVTYKCIEAGSPPVFEQQGDAVEN